MMYDLDLHGMSVERVYELIDKGLAYEQAKCESCPVVNEVLEALCGKCCNEPLSRNCMLRTACPKRGAMKRVFAVIEEQRELEE